MLIHSKHNIKVILFFGNLPILLPFSWIYRNFSSLFLVAILPPNGSIMSHVEIWNCARIHIFCPTLVTKLSWLEPFWNQHKMWHHHFARLGSSVSHRFGHGPPTSGELTRGGRGRAALLIFFNPNFLSLLNLDQCSELVLRGAISFCCWISMKNSSSGM